MRTKYFRNTNVYANTVKRLIDYGNELLVSHWIEAEKKWIESGYSVSELQHAPFERISRAKVRARGIKA